jgi:hypothetical protein
MANAIAAGDAAQTSNENALLGAGTKLVGYGMGYKGGAQ